MASSARNLQKIFVGNLSWTINSTVLRRYFEEFGRVASSNVVFDKKTGCSKGYGFVVFQNKTALENIEKVNKHILEGQQMDVKIAT